MRIMQSLKFFKLGRISKLTLMLGAGLVALVLVQLVAQGQTPPGPPIDKTKITPRATVPPSETLKTEATYEAGFQRFVESQKALASNFNSSNVDPRSLVWVESQRDVAPAPRDLDTAVRQSVLIFSGNAASVKFEFNFALVTFTVEDVVKAADRNILAGSQVTVVLPFGPERAPNNQLVMVYHPAIPPVLRGERAILILRLTDIVNLPAGTYGPQGINGVNKIEASQVKTVQGSALAPFNNRSSAEVTQALLDAVGRTR